MPPKSLFHLPAQDDQGTSCTHAYKPADVPLMKRCRRRVRRRKMISSRSNRDSTAVHHWSPQSISYRSLKSFLKQSRGLKAKEFIEILFPILGLHVTSIPFRAQHLILQTLQRHLEHSAFQFVQKWLQPQSLAVGWTWPEALELHKFFKFLARNRSKISSEQHGENITTVQNLRHSIAGIRHAAVHRLAQDRDSLLEKNCAAIEFCLRIDENHSAESLCRLFEFLQKTLPKSSRVQVQPQQAVPSHPRLPELSLRTQLQERSIPTDVIKRLVGGIEQDLISEVMHFLQIEFP
ncbi:hypothetical protein N7533_011755 [Penicillium manginii]|uniref:uncharacterized protein n=1 Tax=Penicillium manginii TaxID=203109 RepID=UPI0025476AA5|nr:uncharacterized protein N7533_011755 [Penicillium manginii]KAJ5742346.1 hypothetical protein N7533_011755 [Penicillium manginii]